MHLREDAESGLLPCGFCELNTGIETLLKLKFAYGSSEHPTVTHNAGLAFLLQAFANAPNTRHD